MEHIFNEFSKTSLSDWLTRIEADLKGKPLASLQSNPEPDLEIVAYHHLESAPLPADNGTTRNLKKSTNDWEVREEFYGNKADNKIILEALNQGITSIGLSIKDPKDIESLGKNVQFEYIASDLTFETLNTALNTKVPVQSLLNFDIIALNAREGKNTWRLGDYYSFYQVHPKSKSIWVSGDVYGMAGASTVQELAFTIAHLNEYIQFLKDQGESLATINEKMTVSLSVNEDYFVNIAKFRVIKALIALIFEGYDKNYEVKQVKIHAKTNLRHYARNDKNNNPLRQTTQAMSAVLGGCDILTVNYPNFGSENEQKRFQRIAKNIQLILKEESYLDKVVDPAGGSYYLESLTTQILEKSWKLFLEVENQGGLMAALSNEFVQAKIKDNTRQLIADLNLNQRTFLGVNKHPNSMEDWIAITLPKMGKPAEYSPLVPFYLEDHFTKTTA